MMYYWKYNRNTCVHKQTHNKGLKKEQANSLQETTLS